MRETVSAADWVDLAEDEAVRWSGRPAKVTLLPAAVVMLVLVMTSAWLTLRSRAFVEGEGLPPALGYLPLVIAVAGIAYGVWRLLAWLRLLYVITDGEIYVKIGLVSRDVTQIPLSRVQNTNYRQSVLERVFAYGDIYVYTAGTDTDDVVLKNVPNPKRVKEHLTVQLSGENGL